MIALISGAKVHDWIMGQAKGFKSGHWQYYWYSLWSKIIRGHIHTVLEALHSEQLLGTTYIRTEKTAFSQRYKIECMKFIHFSPNGYKLSKQISPSFAYKNASYTIASLLS